MTDKNLSKPELPWVGAAQIIRRLLTMGLLALLAFVLLVAPMVHASAPQERVLEADLAATPRAHIAVFSSACKDAQRRTRHARRSLARAKRAIQRARTKSAKRKARARAKKKRARKTVNRMRQRQAIACANRPPEFPDPMRGTFKTNYSYDEFGRLAGVTTQIMVETPATDPDGDALTYTWTALEGGLLTSFFGLNATFEHLISFGGAVRGAVRIDVSDGRGGSDQFTFVLE